MRVVQVVRVHETLGNIFVSVVGMAFVDLRESAIVRDVVSIERIGSVQR